VPPINPLASTLNQTIQTSTQQSAAQQTETGARPTVTLSAFFGGLMTSALTNYSTYSPGDSTGTVEGTGTVALDATTGRVQANFNGPVTRDPNDSYSNHLPGQVAYKYDSPGYGNYDAFGATPAKGANGQPTSTIDGLPIYDQAGAMVVLSGAVGQQYGNAIKPGLTVCTCDYTRWGTWVSTSQQQVGYDNYYDAAVGYWVAGRSIGANEVPLSGSASYAGHVIGVDNVNGNVAGNLTTTVDFANRTGTAAVAGFGGVNYSGSLGLGSSDPRNISASLTGAGRTMSLTGSFFRGVSSPVGEMGGSMSVSGPSYIASGIFAAKMQ